MSWLDIVLALMLLWGGIVGYRRGFFREAASFFGLVIGIFLAIIVADIVGRVLSGMVDWNLMPYKVAAFFITFFLVVLALWAVGASLTRLFKAIMMNFFNRLAGFVFGVLKSAMLISVAFFFFRLVNENWTLIPDSAFTNSRIYGLLEGLAPWLFSGLSLF